MSSQIYIKMSVFQPPPRRPFDHDSDNELDDPPAEDGYMNITNVYSDNEPEVTQAATTPIAKATSSLTGGKRGAENLDEIQTTPQQDHRFDEAEAEEIGGNSEAFINLKKSLSSKKAGKKEVDAIYDFIFDRTMLKSPSAVNGRAHDVDIIYNAAAASNATARDKNTLHNNIFYFLSTICQEMSSKDPAATWVQYEELALHFDYCLSPIWAQSREHQEGLLSHFPENKLPDSFLAFIEDVKKKEPTKAFKDLHKTHISNGKVSANLIRVAYFGSKVQENASKAKTFINNYCNKLWVEQLPSGIEISCWLLLMRIELWRDVAYNRSRENFNGVYNSKRKQNTALPPFNHLNFVKEINEGKAAFEEAYFDNSWCTFIYLGLPSGNNLRDSLASGRASLQHKANTILTTDVVSKKVRQAAAAATAVAASTSPVSDISTNSTLAHKSLTIHHRSDSDFLVLPALYTQITSVHKQIFDLLQNLEDESISEGLKAHTKVMLATANKHAKILEENIKKLESNEMPGPNLMLYESTI